MTFEPIIKWTGSKRKQASEIVSRFPKKIDTYYEPFLGGGSIMRQLLESNIIVNKYVCSDLNKDLIILWEQIKNNYEQLSNNYNIMWNELNKDNNINRKKEYYNYVRNRCNKNHNPSDFLFISRTTVNGLIRYNNQGELNNSFHLTRNGIKPEKLNKILKEWTKLIQNVEFKQCDYISIISESEDFLYVDPPYFATKGIYYGALNYNMFWSWLKNQKGKYIFSFDGKTNKEDYTISVPKDVYSEHEYLYAGNSSFRRIIGKSNDTYVYESIYIK
jgi:DNA adenine methylase